MADRVITKVVRGIKGIEPPDRGPDAAPPVGRIARALVAEYPGIQQVPGQVVPSRKPTEDETPYRSLQFVLPRHSADGNGYAPGDPIPVAEAIRQGQGEVVRAGLGAPYEVRCPSCGGSGTRAGVAGAKRSANHRPDCKCPMHLPCVKCEGKRFLPADEPARGKVTDIDRIDVHAQRLLQEADEAEREVHGGLAEQ